MLALGDKNESLDPQMIPKNWFKPIETQITIKWKEK